MSMRFYYFLNTVPCITGNPLWYRTLQI